MKIPNNLGGNSNLNIFLFFSIEKRNLNNLKQCSSSSKMASFILSGRISSNWIKSLFSLLMGWKSSRNRVTLCSPLSSIFTDKSSSIIKTDRILTEREISMKDLPDLSRFCKIGIIPNTLKSYIASVFRWSNWYMQFRIEIRRLRLVAFYSSNIRVDIPWILLKFSPII